VNRDLALQWPRPRDHADVLGPNIWTGPFDLPTIAQGAIMKKDRKSARAADVRRRHDWIASWRWIAGVGAGLAVTALVLASALPLSACGGKCKYCEADPRVAVECLAYSASSCPTSAECEVRNGCLCASPTEPSRICSATNTSCDIYDSQHCQASKGCVWGSGCFDAVECPTVPLTECTTHPTCMIVEQGCP
jgi:hypothetical protein